MFMLRIAGRNPRRRKNRDHRHQLLRVKLAGVVQTFVVVFLIIVGIMLVTGSFMSGEVSNMEPFFTGTTACSPCSSVVVTVPLRRLRRDSAGLAKSST